MSLSRFFRRKRWDAERAAEVQAYLEIETAYNIARGMTAQAARGAARRKLGNLTLIREDIYHMNSIGFVETLWRDLRYALRLLRKNPGFTLAALASLALGIGANTAIFSVVHAVLLKSLPYPDPDRLMILNEYSARNGSESVSWMDYLDWRQQNHSFEDMAAYNMNDFNLTGVDRPEVVRGGRVTSSFFSLVGARTVLGRTFTPDEDQAGAKRTVVLTYPFWRQRLGGDPNVLGKSLKLEGEAYTVIGVLGPTFQYFSKHI